MRGAKRRAVPAHDVGELDLATARARLWRVQGGLPGGDVGALQQFQRRRGLRQVLARQMEVAQRRADVAVAEEPLDGVDVDPGFKEMRGEGVAQRMDTSLLDDSGACL